MDNNTTKWQTIAKSSAAIIRYILDNRELLVKYSNGDTRIATISQLIHRILRNIRGVYILAAESVQHGDSLANFGYDNIRFEKSLTHIAAALRHLMNNSASSR